MGHRVLFSPAHEQKLIALFENAGAVDVNRALERCKALINMNSALFASADILPIEQYSFTRRVRNYAAQLRYWLTADYGQTATELNREDNSSIQSTYDPGLAKIDAASLIGQKNLFTKAWALDTQSNIDFWNLCSSVRSAWHEETKKLLPPIEEASPKNFSDNWTIPSHPLWLVLHTMSIDLDGETMQEIIDFMDGIMPAEPDDFQSFCNSLYD